MSESTVLDHGRKMASEVLGHGMFWRGNLAKAVQRRDFRGALVGIVVLGSLLFLYAWQHMQVVKLSYEVQDLRVQKRGLTNDYYYLKYKLHEVNGLSRVERTAREQLGMETPKSDQVVILEEGGGTGHGWLDPWKALMGRNGEK